MQEHLFFHGVMSKSGERSRQTGTDEGHTHQTYLPGPRGGGAMLHRKNRKVTMSKFRFGSRFFFLHPRNFLIFPLFSKKLSQSFKTVHQVCSLSPLLPFLMHLHMRNGNICFK